MSYLAHLFITCCTLKFPSSSDLCVNLRSVDFTDVKSFTVISMSLPPNLNRLTSTPLLLLSFVVFSKKPRFSDEKHTPLGRSF